jgi:diacylglycerol kinase family enzyme
MREAVFVVNPERVRDLSSLWRHCHQAAAAHGWQADLFVTEAGEASTLLHKYLSAYLLGGDGEPGDKLVFAVGGDGTVRACAHNLVGSGVALAVVPRGTANLFANSLGIPGSLDAALSVGFGGAERSVDVAFADGEPFVAMAGVGLDAAVVGSTTRWSKRHLGWAGYALAALAHLSGPLAEVRIRLDGAEPVAREARTVVVGNVGTLPGGFTLLRGARVDDGLLDVGVLSPRSLVGWADVAQRVVRGRQPPPAARNGDDGVGDGAASGAPVAFFPAYASFEHFRAATVELSAGAPMPRQFDGDLLAPSCSLSVRVAHCALRCRTPVGK